MDRNEKKKNRRTETEVCFVRILELLHDDDLRLVMRDKLEPLVFGGENMLQNNAFAVLRLAHSDDALAVMFEVEAAHCVGTMGFTLKPNGGVCSVEISSDGEKIWTMGISEPKEVHHFGKADEKSWWHVIVMPLAAINLSHNTTALEADFVVSVVDSLASSKDVYADLTIKCKVDLV